MHCVHLPGSWYCAHGTAASVVGHTLTMASGREDEASEYRQDNDDADQTCPPCIGNDTIDRLDDVADVTSSFSYCNAVACQMDGEKIQFLKEDPLSISSEDANKNIKCENEVTGNALNFVDIPVVIENNCTDSFNMTTYSTNHSESSSNVNEIETSSMSAPADCTLTEMVELRKHLNTPAPHRPRSCSSTLEALMPLAMMTPLLVASSPLTRSTPSLQLLNNANIATTLTSLTSQIVKSTSQDNSKTNIDKNFPNWSKISNDHQRLRSSSEIKVSKPTRPTRSSHPLSIPKNPFRRSSLQMNKPSTSYYYKERNDNDNQKMSDHAYKRKDKPPLSRKPYSDTPYKRHRSSTFGDIFQLKSRGSISGCPTPSVAVVKPLQVCIYQLPQRAYTSLFRKR